MRKRFAQYLPGWRYIEPLGLEIPIVGRIDPVPIQRYNVAPHSRVLILHWDPDGLRFEPVMWGWQPFWSIGKHHPAINARSKTAATGNYYKAIWSSGRCVIPADGWYEWAQDPGNVRQKLPFYIHRRDKHAMYFAGLGQFRRNGSEPEPGDGFVLITADGDTGLIDDHTRRPVVLSPDCAINWMNPELDSSEAERIMHESDEPDEAFEWYEVSKAVGNIRNEGPNLIEQVYR